MSLIYHLEIEAKFCNVLGLVNKFPIYTLDAERPSLFSKPINSALIGKNNLIELIITPTNLFDVVRNKYSVKGCIKTYDSAEFVGPEEGEIVKSFKHEQTPAISLEFDNNKFNYSKLLVQGEQIKDKELVREYARKLIRILRSGDTNAVLSEFKPKLIDYAIAYDMQPDEMFTLFTNYLKEKYFLNKPKVDVADFEINLVPWCDHRIWEIGIGMEMKEFMYTEPDENNMEYSTQIFVGLINNQLKVVR